MDLKIGNETLHENDVERTVPQNLVGNVNVAAFGVACLRTEQGNALRFGECNRP